MPWVGAVPSDVTAWAKSILADEVKYPMFSETRAVIDGVPMVAQVQHHTMRASTGETGLCIRGVSVFRDVPATTVNSAMMLSPDAFSGWNAQSSSIRTIELVFLAFVALGSAYTIANALINERRR
jgi:hypothetical protein